MAYEQPINPPERKAQVDPKADTRPEPKVEERKQRNNQSGGKEEHYSI